MKLLTSLLSICLLLHVSLSDKLMFPRGKLIESVVCLSNRLALMSDFASGNIMLTDMSTRKMFTVVRAPKNRTIQGLAYLKKSGLVVTCGGGRFLNTLIQGALDSTPNVANVQFPRKAPTGIFTYNLTSGVQYAKCTVPGASIINDVVVDSAEKFAYFTETRKPFIYRMRLANVRDCDIEKLKLPKSFDSKTDGITFGGVGIVYFKKRGVEGLIISNLSEKAFYFFNLKVAGDVYKVAETEAGIEGMKTIRNTCIVGASNLGRVDRFRINVNKNTKKVKLVFKGSIWDPQNEINDPVSVAVCGRSVIAPSQNFTLLAGQGQLYAAVKKLPAKVC